MHEHKTQSEMEIFIPSYGPEKSVDVTNPHKMQCVERAFMPYVGKEYPYQSVHSRSLIRSPIARGESNCVFHF